MRRWSGAGKEVESLARGRRGRREKKNADRYTLNRWQVNNFLTQKTGKAGEEVLLICTAVKTVFGQKHIWLLDPLFELLPQSKVQPKALLNIGF